MSEPKNPTHGAETGMKWRPLGSRVVVRQALAPDDPMIGSMYLPVGAQGAELHGAAGAARADARAFGKRSDGGPATGDEGVAGICALGDGGHG